METLRYALKMALYGCVTCLLAGCGVSQAVNAVAAASASAVQPGFVYLGPYNPATKYVAMNVVTYQGSSYVAITDSLQLAPAGEATSPGAWSVLALAGAKGIDGLQGPAGVPGAAGPAGAKGEAGVAGPAGIQGVAGVKGEAGAAGPAGIAGPAGEQGVAGTVGPRGASGAQDAAGAGGANGLPGAVGATGPMGPAGPSGPTGAMGPQGLTKPTQASYLAGRHLAVQGDSISAQFSQAWQDVVIARTGMSLVYQDARGGRRFDTAFECWGNPAAGGPLGVFDSTQPNGAGYCGTESIGLSDGMSLAQSLADVDMLIIELGTNDVRVSLGALGDPITTRTYYGNMRWLVEAYLAAKPSLRIVMVTVQSNGSVTPAVTQQYADATVAYANSMGIPVLNMAKLGGVNPITALTLVPDGTHPSSAAFQNNYGPLIAQFVQSVF